MSAPADELKCRRLQVHLSTIIVLMVVAGVLVWANLRDYGTVICVNTADWEETSPIGWPRALTIKSSYYVIFKPAEREGSIYGERHDSFDSEIITYVILPNVAIALAILTTVVLSCEYLIRRREKMKQSHP